MTQLLAPALRACVDGSDNQLARFADVSEAALIAAVDASVDFLKEQLLQKHRRIQNAVRAKVRIQEQLDKSPGKFSVRKMATGSIDDFHKGLQDRIGEYLLSKRTRCDLNSNCGTGSPNLDFLKAMRAEHMTRGGSNYSFVTGNYSVMTQARSEWLYVAGDENGKRLLPPASEMSHTLENGNIIQRIIQPIDELLQKKLAKEANLTREEMIAIVLYTGPAFVIYNAVLRRFPAHIYKVFKDADNLFSTTIFVLVSAINKLSRRMNIPQDTILYRGLGGTLDFPDSFYRPLTDCATPNALGFAEYGFMSTTADKHVAVQYSGVQQGKPKACIMQIRPNSVDRGADISEFSQYPAEKEFLFVPNSFIQGEGQQRTEVVDGGGIVTIVPVRVNINLKTETVEELKEKKKWLHLASARAIVEEVRHELGEWAVGTDASTRLQRDTTRNQGGSFTAVSLAAKIVEQCADVVRRHEAMAVEDYVDDGMFRSLVSEMLDTKAWAKEKARLWIQDASQNICFLQGWSLRDCHRLFQSFLRKNIDCAADGSLQKATASIELLISRGLVSRGVRGEVNADGEDVMVQAGGDGWVSGDIAAAAAAGAEVCATDGRGCHGIWNAARYGHADAIEALLAARGDVNMCSNDGRSPVFNAAQNGHNVIVAQLVSARGDVNKCNKNGASPLYVASQNGHGAIISTLVRARGDVTKCRNDGTSPIYVAAQNGHSDIIAQLVSAGGSVNTCDNEGASPIFVAAQKSSKGHAACILQLLESGADPRSSYKGTSALDMARQQGHPESVRVLEAALNFAIK
jgi:hypothetical protein